MSASPAIGSPLPVDLTVESERVRVEQPPPLPVSGSSATGKTNRAQEAPAEPTNSRDEVKVQWDSPDRIVVYQFVNQNGSLILQVPSEQEINLARQIAQDLAREAQHQQAAPSVGGKE